MKYYILGILALVSATIAFAQTAIPDFKTMSSQPNSSGYTSWGSCGDFVYAAKQTPDSPSGYYRYEAEYYDGNSWKSLPVARYKGTAKSLHMYKNKVYLFGNFKETSKYQAPSGTFIFILQLVGNNWDTVMNSNIPDALASSTLTTVESGFYLLETVNADSAALHRYLPSSGIVSSRTINRFKSKTLSHLLIEGKKNTVLLYGNISQFNGSASSTYIRLVNDTVRTTNLSGGGVPVRAGIDYNEDIVYMRETGGGPYRFSKSTGLSTEIKYNIMYTMLGYIMPRNGEVIFGPGKQLNGVNYDFYKDASNNYWHTVKTNAGAYTIMVNENLGYFVVDINTNTWRQLTTVPGAIVKGKFYADLDKNCTFNSSNDTILRDEVVNFSSTSNAYTCVTDENGDYLIILPLDSFVLGKVNSEYTLNSCATKYVVTDTNGNYTLNIPVYPNYNDDLECKILGSSVARIDGKSVYNIRIRNRGLQTRNALVTLQYDQRAVYANSTLTPSTTNAGVLTWNLTNITPLSKRNFSVQFDLPFDSLKLGDSIFFYLSLDTMYGEDDTTNNHDTLKQIMVYSYDPNSKESNYDGKTTIGIKKLRYFIQFQNEGNDYAKDVVVRDSLPSQLSPEGISLLGTSHACKTSLVNGVYTFTFNDIYLQPKSKDEPASKGWISFEIALDEDLPAGTEIKNNAYIYFDRNDPVITNYSTVLLTSPTGSTKRITKSNNLVFYPNPAENYVVIQNPLNRALEIQIIDLKGQVLVQKTASPNVETSIDIATLPAGLYIIKSEVGSKKMLKLE